MTISTWRWFSVALLAIALLAPASAPADVGVEKIIRGGGAPGEEVPLTMGCGFCYPSCDGVLGDRSGVCMPGSEAPPASFPVSLVPIEKAPKPYRCGPNAYCAPRTMAPPGRPPFTLLGRATPPGDGDGARQFGGVWHQVRHVPRYLLDFEIPDLRPGIYTYVIYCETCSQGKGGSLIAYPRDRQWRLSVRSSSPEATIGSLRGGVPGRK